MQKTKTMNHAIKILERHSDIDIIAWAKENKLTFKDNDAGKHGFIVESMLGKSRDNNPTPDFGTFELKTTLVHNHGCKISGKKRISSIYDKEKTRRFRTSKLYPKLKRMIFVGIGAETNTIDYIAFWDLTRDTLLRRMFEEDYNEIQRNLKRRGLNTKDAKYGGEWICHGQQNGYPVWAFRPRFVRNIFGL